jgi:hypothetical protein
VNVSPQTAPLSDRLTPPIAAAAPSATVAEAGAVITGSAVIELLLIVKAPIVAVRGLEMVTEAFTLSRLAVPDSEMFAATSISGPSGVFR